MRLGGGLPLLLVNKAEVVADLHRQGIGQVLILTGDNQTVAQAIAGKVGIDDWHAALLPADKSADVTELRARYGPIAIVGNGINDAPAGATADVGIAMGAIGHRRRVGNRRHRAHG